MVQAFTNKLVIVRCLGKCKDSSWNFISNSLGCGVLTLCKESVDVFCCPKRKGHGTLIREDFTPSAEMQSMYFAAPTD